RVIFDRELAIGGLERDLVRSALDFEQLVIIDFGGHSKSPLPVRGALGRSCPRHDLNSTGCCSPNAGRERGTPLESIRIATPSPPLPRPLPACGERGGTFVTPCCRPPRRTRRRRLPRRSEEHTSELQSRRELVCRLLLEK